MFGTVLATLNSSPCRPLPRAATSSAERTNPLIRETTVPAAITALEERIFWSLMPRSLRIRRTSRTAMARNSSPTPTPRISQITWLTCAERTGSVAEEPSGDPVSSVTTSRT